MGKRERRQDWPERELQLSIDLMTVLDDRIGSSRAKLIFQSCPMLACHGWHVIHLNQLLDIDCSKKFVALAKEFL